LRPAKAGGHCQPYPFGTSFTAEEQRLLPALALLRDRTSDPWSKASVVLSALETGGMNGRYDPELRRMGLEAPR
ncbi:hypothetical protein, partial [Enterobacter kobei]|uniref:hypothetical protein n=1 Tax=Enterobacter kobei TaxID=208224 RepID=UPI0019544642